MSPLVRFFLPMNSIPRAVGAGFVWGAIPCGMVYTVLALAIGTGNGVFGGLVMFAFWLGTLPLLFGAGGTLSLMFRTPGTTKLAGLGMTLVGVVGAWSTLPSLDGVHHHHDATVSVDLEKTESS